jgi:hypothetical protein
MITSGRGARWPSRGGRANRQCICSQFLLEGVMAYGRRWTRRAQAVEEIKAKRGDLELQGWSAD